MVGQPAYADENRRLTAAIESGATPLIMVHRGTHAGLVVQNTIGAVVGAVASGADLIEIDLCRSVDGVFYVFHDSYELDLLGVRHNLRTLSSPVIDGLTYFRSHGVSKPAPVERAADLLGRFRGEPVLFNVDRSWWWWPEVFELLDSLDMTDQLVLKSPPTDEFVESLAAHPVKYPFTPMVRTMAEAVRFINHPGLNLVGLELIADRVGHPFTRPECLDELRSHDLLLIANAEVIGQDQPLFARWDDEVALFESPDKGWGPLFDLGLDVIQTDWPWLLRDYRSERNARP